MKGFGLNNLFKNKMLSVYNNEYGLSLEKVKDNPFTSYLVSKNHFYNHHSNIVKK